MTKPLWEVSLNMVVGSSTLGLIKITGKVENKKAVVLIDYGATHNFISHQVVTN